MRKYIEIGNRLKKLRGDVSQKEFAKKIGVSYPSYQRYEYGERIPPGPILSKIADTFYVSTDYILTGSEESLRRYINNKRIEFANKDEEFKLVDEEIRSSLFKKGTTFLQNISLIISVVNYYKKHGIDILSMAEKQLKSISFTDKEPMEISKATKHRTLGHRDYPIPNVDLLLVVDNHQAYKIQNTKTKEYYTPIPLVSNPIASGCGREINYDYVEGLIYYNWVRSRNMVATRVIGASMEPTFPEGSILAIDLEDRRYQPEKVFAVKYKGECTLKRLTKERGFLILQSDNPNKDEYPNQVINLQEEPEPIIGRIVFAWLKF
ncbi:MAG: LexA family transcriptional regulator [Pseudomonadota bacterium]